MHTTLSAKPRISILMDTNMFPFSWLIYLNNSSSTFHHFLTSSRQSYLYFLSRGLFHLKGSIFVEVIKVNFPVDSSIRITVFFKLSVKRIYSNPRIQYFIKEEVTTIISAQPRIWIWKDLNTHQIICILYLHNISSDF